jgi:hypothetical protein
MKRDHGIKSRKRLLTPFSSVLMPLTDAVMLFILTSDDYGNTCSHTEYPWNPARLPARTALQWRPSSNAGSGSSRNWLETVGSLLEAVRTSTRATIHTALRLPRRYSVNVQVA